MKLKIIKGDITQEKVDVIVNAANSSLMGGGGVDGAIHRVGGPAILEECKAIIALHGPCQTGEAVYTQAGQLNAKYVIHTVGPVWRGGKGDESIQLANCYKNSLALADQLEAESVAFPNISTGVYGYPKQQAAEVALKSIQAFQPVHLKEVHLVCFDDESFQIYQLLLHPD